MHANSFNAAEGSVVRLSPQQIEPYLSPYLMGGWRQDQFVLDTVDVEPGRVRGLVLPAEHFVHGDGAFHLTMPAVFIWVAQLAIIYGCWDQGLSSKPGEIYVRDIHLKCKRPVRSTSGIEFILALLSKRQVAEGVFYAGSIAVDDEAFLGEGTFVLPLPG